MARSALIDLRRGENEGRFSNVLTRAKERFDHDARYRFDHKISPNYHVETVLPGTIQYKGKPYEMVVYGRFDKYSPGIATQVEADRHLLVPFNRSHGLKRFANLPVELVQAIMGTGRFYYAAGGQFQPEMTGEQLGKNVAAFLKKARTGETMELIFGDYADRAKVEKEYPRGKVVVTIVPKPDHARVGKNEGYVHVRVSQNVPVAHIGEREGMLPLPSFKITDYPTKGQNAIQGVLDYFDEVTSEIGRRVKTANPFQGHTHLRRDAHYYFDGNSRFT